MIIITIILILILILIQLLSGACVLFADAGTVRFSKVHVLAFLPDPGALNSCMTQCEVMHVSDGEMIRLETLTELKIIIASLSSLSSYWN